MKEGFYFSEPSPDLFSGTDERGRPKKSFSWWRVAHHHPAGQETVMVDFIFDAATAHLIARNYNIEGIA